MLPLPVGLEPEPSPIRGSLPGRGGELRGRVAGAVVAAGAPSPLLPPPPLPPHGAEGASCFTTGCAAASRAAAAGAATGSFGCCGTGGSRGRRSAEGGGIVLLNGVVLLYTAALGGAGADRLPRTPKSCAAAATAGSTRADPVAVLPHSGCIEAAGGCKAVAAATAAAAAAALGPFHRPARKCGLEALACSCSGGRGRGALSAVRQARCAYCLSHATAPCSQRGRRQAAKVAAHLAVEGGST